MVSWTYKYKPTRRSEIVGNIESVNSIIAYLNRFRSPNLRSQLKKKALLLYGPPGIGKTSSVLAIANSLNLDIVVVNASDKRNKNSLKSIRNASIFSSLKEELDSKVVGQILLIDEVDGLSGNADRGGIREIVEIIKSTRIPIILTANDISPQKFQTLRKHCELREFKPPLIEEISGILQRIADKENIEISKHILLEIIEISKNDIRGSINSLQLLASRKNSVNSDDLKVLSYREQSVEIREFLKTLFIEADGDKALRQSRLINDMDYSKLLLLLRDVTTHFIPGKNYDELAKAYDIISRADLILTRAQRERVWSQLSFFYKLCTVELVNTIKPSKSLPSFPDWQLQIPSYWITLARQKKSLKIASKIGKKYRVSKKKVINTYFPYIHFIFNNNAEMAANLAIEFNLFEIEPGKKKIRIIWNGDIDFFTKRKDLNREIKKRIREIYPTLQKIHQEDIDPKILNAMNLRHSSNLKKQGKDESKKKFQKDKSEQKEKHERKIKDKKLSSKNERTLSDFF